MQNEMQSRSETISNNVAPHHLSNRPGSNWLLQQYIFSPVATANNPTGKPTVAAVRRLLDVPFHDHVLYISVRSSTTAQNVTKK